MAKWALIGGAGVFAVHTAKMLLNRGDRVISIGRNPPKLPHYSLNVEGKDYRYEQIHMVFEQDRLKAVLDDEKPDYVVNFAALAYATSWKDSHRYYDTNIVALSVLTEWLTGKSWLKKFVQIGTSELYGSVDKPADENFPLKPTSPYAVSKLAADLHLETLFRVQGFPMNILRPSNAYGEGQQVWRIIPRACLCAVSGEKLPLEGGGTVEKSYIHAYDLAKAIILVAEKAPSGETYNCGPDAPVTIRRIVEVVCEVAGIPMHSIVTETPGRVGEDQRYWLDSSKINALGWRPEIDLHEGIACVLEWAKEHHLSLRKESTSFVLRA